MIKPVNGHLLIEPLKHESFIASDKNTYEEVGIVIDVPEHNVANEFDNLIGKKVYFDSWLAGKFPKNDTEFFWLVNWNDVKAVDDGK